jgi:NADH:ubiquinone oxidoreductase subunit H
MILKTLLLLSVLVASRHLLARVRIERFVVVAWALLIPLALANVLVSGLFLL